MWHCARIGVVTKFQLTTMQSNAKYKRREEEREKKGIEKQNIGS
jgi:hypothetical protein